METIPASRLAVWHLRSHQGVAPPGESLHYSNMGYLTLGYVLESVTGSTYAEAIGDLVFNPLGMVHSSGSIEADGPSLVRGHHRLGDSSQFEPLPPEELTGGHAAVCCSAFDLARFLTMLLDHGRFDAKGFLSERTFSVMTQPATSSRSWGYGYGLFVKTPARSGDPHLIHHGGENPGFETAMIGDLSGGLGVVVLVNSYESPWALATYALELLRAANERRRLPEPQTESSPDPTNVGRLSLGPSGDWEHVVGHYRAHAPLLSDYRVVESAGGLILESNGFYEQDLTPVDRFSFRIGSEPAEVASFDVMIDGKAQRATIGGGVYARVDTP